MGGGGRDGDGSSSPNRGIGETRRRIAGKSRFRCDTPTDGSDRPPSAGLSLSLSRVQSRGLIDGKSLAFIESITIVRATPRVFPNAARSNK